MYVISVFLHRNLNSRPTYHSHLVSKQENEGRSRRGLEDREPGEGSSAD